MQTRFGKSKELLENLEAANKQATINAKELQLALERAEAAVDRLVKTVNTAMKDSNKAIERHKAARRSPNR